MFGSYNYSLTTHIERKAFLLPQQGGLFGPGGAGTGVPSLNPYLAFNRGSAVQFPSSKVIFYEFMTDHLRGAPRDPWFLHAADTTVGCYDGSARKVVPPIDGIKRDVTNLQAAMSDDAGGVDNGWDFGLRYNGGTLGGLIEYFRFTWGGLAGRDLRN
jgi:hypothetical protein